MKSKTSSTNQKLENALEHLATVKRILQKPCTAAPGEAAKKVLLAELTIMEVMNRGRKDV